METAERIEGSRPGQPGQPSAPAGTSGARAETMELIIQKGMEIIGRTGFNATGLDAVLKEARVPKGSFYYYFRSKEDFGLAVIDRFAEESKRRLQGFLLREDQTPLTRIRSYLTAVAQAAEAHECRRGCLIGNLSQELAAQNERFRERLDQVLEDWRKILARCLGEAQQKGEVPVSIDADRMAGFVLAGLQGSLLRSKVMKSAVPIKDFIDVFFNWVLR